MEPAASQMEKRGIRTDKGEVNRQIAADNKLLKEIKARITRLQAIAAQKQEGAALMTLLENGAWAACRAPQSPAKVFQTEQAARDYLSDCESVIIIDI